MSPNSSIIASQLFIILVGVFSPIFLVKQDYIFFVEIAQVLAITNIIFNDGTEVARLRDDAADKLKDLQILNFIISLLVVASYIYSISDLQYATILLFVPFVQLISKWIRLDLAVGRYRRSILENFFSWAMIKIIFTCLTFLALKDYLNILAIYLITYVLIFTYQFRENIRFKLNSQVLANFFSITSLNTKIRTFSLSLDLTIVVGYVLSPDLAVTYVILRNLEIMFISLFDQLIFKIVALREELGVRRLLIFLPYFSITLLFIGVIIYYHPILKSKDVHFYIYILQFFFLPAATAFLLLTTGKTMLVNTRDGNRSLGEKNYTYCIALLTVGSIAFTLVIDWAFTDYIPLIFIMRAGALFLETRWWNVKHP